MAHTQSFESTAAWQATLETVASLVSVVRQGQGLHEVLPGDSESLASESEVCIAHGLFQLSERKQETIFSQLCL